MPDEPVPPEPADAPGPGGGLVRGPAPPPVAPPGWYPDPWGERPVRWWDGSAWTGHLADDDRAESPVPELGPAKGGAGGDMPWVPLRRGAARWGALAFVVALLAGVAASIPLELAEAPGPVLILAFYAVSDGLLLFLCVRLVRRFATGSLRADLGVTFRRRDVGRGLLVFLLAAAASAVAILPFAGNEELDDAEHELVEQADEPGGLLVMAIVAVAFAPVVEEMFFRGLLLRSLTRRMRFRWANVVQGAAFAVAHVDPFAGLGNATYIASVGAFGLVCGWSARRYESLGPAMVAHAARNALAVALAPSL